MDKTEMEFGPLESTEDQEENVAGSVRWFKGEEPSKQLDNKIMARLASVFQRLVRADCPIDQLPIWEVLDGMLELSQAILFYIRQREDQDLDVFPGEDLGEEIAENPFGSDPLGNVLLEHFRVYRKVDKVDSRLALLLEKFAVEMEANLGLLLRFRPECRSSALRGDAEIDFSASNELAERIRHRVSIPEVDWLARRSTAYQRTMDPAQFQKYSETISSECSETKMRRVQDAQTGRDSKRNPIPGASKPSNKKSKKLIRQLSSILQSKD